MTVVAQELISEEDIATFERDGVVVLRNVFTDWMEPLREGVRKLMADPGPMERSVVPEDGTAAFFQDLCNWQRIPEFSDFVQHSNAGALAASLMRSRSARFFHDHVLVKQPGGSTVTPWHQDQPYYNIDGRQNISMWLPVDPVPRAATLEFVGGSHQGPWLMPRSFMDKQAKWFPEGSLQDLPDIEADRSAHNILGWELQPGDAVFFHMLALHSSKGSATTRRVFSVRFLGDDITHAPRNWVTSPDFPGLAERLPAGAPMHDDDLFPLLYSA